MRALILALAMLAATTPALAADAWTGRVLRVVDGDTLDVAGPDGAPVRVRLYAVDAPERDQPGGEAAALEIKAWIHNLGDGEVKVIPVSVDHHGRTVARVQAGGMDLGRVLAEQCLAWIDTRFCGVDCLIAYAPYATLCHQDQRGLWADKTAVRPSEWRAGKRP